MNLSNSILEKRIRKGQGSIEFMVQKYTLQKELKIKILIPAQV